MFRKIEYRSKDFQPAAVGTTETTAVFSVRAGERVLWASAKPLIAAAASTNCTMDLGDGDDTDGYIVGATSGTAGTFDLETATVGIAIAGAGALLANSGGKLYLADDTVDVVYTHATNGATNPKVRFRIAVVNEGP